MYELIVLALLMHWPMHGYFITKISNDIVGPWEKVNRGSMYPLLNKMAQTGLIQPATQHDGKCQTTDRRSKVYEITTAGRQRFFKLMLNTTSGLTHYQRLFHIKAMHLDFLSPEDQLHLIDHYLTYCQTAIQYQKQEIQDAGAKATRAEMNDFFFESVVDYMHYIAGTWTGELEWAQQLRERIMATTLPSEEQEQASESS